MGVKGSGTGVSPEVLGELGVLNATSKPEGLESTSDQLLRDFELNGIASLHNSQAKKPLGFEKAVEGIEVTS